MAAAAALLALPAAAQTTVSLSSSSNWSNTAAWNPAVVPNNGPGLQYNVVIGGGRTATLDIDVEVKGLSIGGSSSAYSSLTLAPNRTLTVDGSFAAGLYAQVNGGGTLTLVGSAGVTSSSAGNSALFFDNVTFNNQSASTFSDNAANGAFSTRLGNGAVIHNAGIYSLDGVGSSLLASAGGGSFDNSGTLRGSGSVAVPVTNTGTITAAANANAGSAGVLSFSAGGSSSGTVNTGSTANQAVALTAGSWNFSSSSVNAGAGVFRVTGAAVTIAGAHNVTGQTQVGSGSLTFTHAGTSLAGVLYLYGGTTTLTGANSVNRLDLGNTGTASGSPTAVLALGADGKLNVTGGFNPATYSRVTGSGAASITASGGGTIADNSSMILDGVTLNNAPGSTIGQYNAGGFDVTLQNGAVINNAGTWLLRNQAGRGIVAGAGAAGVGAAFNNTGTLWADQSYTVSRIGLAVSNSGTLRLDTGAGGGGNPTLAVGSLVQTAGSTQLAHDNGNFATLSSSGTLAFNGGNLVGNGRLLGAVQVSGSDTLVSPGYGAGQINVQGSYVQTDGSLKLEIGRTAAGAGGLSQDKLTSTGALSLTGTAISFALLSGSLPLQPGDAFTVLASTGNLLTMAGDAISFDAALAGYTFQQTQTASGYTLTILSSVPEPATWRLFALAAFAALCASGGRAVRQQGGPGRAA